MINRDCRRREGQRRQGEDFTPGKVVFWIGEFASAMLVGPVQSGYGSLF
jgi:hypothetical protein